MSEEQARCILQNQIEIMNAISLLLRYVEPSLVGGGGEMDATRNDLYQRYKDTMAALSAPPVEAKSEVVG